MSLRVAERGPAVAPRMAGDSRLKRVLRIGEGAIRECNTGAIVEIDQSHRPFYGFRIVNEVYLGSKDPRVVSVYHAINEVKEELRKLAVAEGQTNTDDEEQPKRAKLDISYEKNVSITTTHDLVIRVQGTLTTRDHRNKTVDVEVTLSATRRTSGGRVETYAVTPIGPTSLLYTLSTQASTPDQQNDNSN